MDIEFMRPLNNYPNVWLAKDVQINRKVIVKFDSDKESSFLIESAKALVRVRHINIVKIFAVTVLEHPETNEATECIVMNYIEGNTLLRLLDNNITVTTLFKLGNQLIDAIEAIHANGLAHGDLHDENILISSEEVLKIIDMYPNRSFSKLTETNKETRIQSDLISLLRILIEMFRGSSLRKKTSLFSDSLNKEKLSIREIRKAFALQFENGNTSHFNEIEKLIERRKQLTRLVERDNSQIKYIDEIKKIEKSIEDERKEIEKLVNNIHKYSSSGILSKKIKRIREYVYQGNYGSASDVMIEMDVEESRIRFIHQQLDIPPEYIDLIDYEISSGHESSDGLLYDYVVTFSEDSPQHLLEKIQGIEKSDGKYYLIIPAWEIDNQEPDFFEEEDLY